MADRATSGRWAAGRAVRFVILVAAIVASLGAGIAYARDRLDQQNVNQHTTGTFGIGIPATPLRAQTFTAHRKGKIDRVGVYLWPNQDNPPSGTIFVDLFPTDADNAPLTTGAPIGSGSISSTIIPQSGGMVLVDLSPRAPIHKGTRYAIVLHADQSIAGVFSWAGSSGPGPDQYPRGDEASRSDPNGAWTLFAGQDFFFQTFVVVRRHHG